MQWKTSTSNSGAEKATLLFVALESAVHVTFKQ
jgi:hypothetical protein